MEDVMEKNNCKANESIKCTVEECMYHCQTADYCSLDMIKVGAHESCPKDSQCVDCQSFAPDVTK